MMFYFIVPLLLFTFWYFIRQSLLYAISDDISAVESFRSNELLQDDVPNTEMQSDVMKKSNN